MTTSPTPTPDTPPMPEGYRIEPRGVYFQKYSKVLGAWRNICRTDSWEFAALMAFLWDKTAMDHLLTEWDSITQNTHKRWEYISNRNAWQRIAEARMKPNPGPEPSAETGVEVAE